MNILNRPGLVNMTVLPALFLSVLLPACGSGTNVPMVRYEVRLEADARTPEICREDLAIRFEPIRVEPQVEGNLYQMTTFSDIVMNAGKPVLDGPGNWECWLTYRSPALSPGKWKIVGEFLTGTQSCLRDVGPGMPNRVRIDQEEGCVEFDATPVPAGPEDKS